MPKMSKQSLPVLNPLATFVEWAANTCMCRWAAVRPNTWRCIPNRRL